MATKRKDPRYKIVRGLIKKKKITTLESLVEYIPVTVLATDMKLSSTAMERLIKKPAKWKIEDIISMAGIIGVDHNAIFRLISESYVSQKLI